MKLRKHTRFYRHILILLLLVFLTLGIIVWNNAGKIYFAAEDTQYMQDTAGELELLVFMKDKLFVKWWKNKEDNSYYIFLPGAVKDQKQSLRLIGGGGIDCVYIDGKKVKNGNPYKFTAGQHELRIGENDSVVYDLNVYFTSNIAALFLETESGTMDEIHASKDYSESGEITIIDGSGRRYFEGKMEEIHCRGNSSFEGKDKKSYTIKLNRKADLFDMGAAKKWILMANPSDETRIRNAVAFSLAKASGLEYTPDIQHVDVYANGSFIGNYLLTEKVEVGQSRVNVKNLEDEVDALNDETLPQDREFFMEQQGRLFSTKGYRVAREPEDISGGYLLEIETSDRYGLEASGFLTSRMQAVVFASPKYASFDQVSYIAELYQDFEDAVFAKDGYSPYTGIYYSEYIDMDSFARKYLFEEIVKNLDASFTSQYFYKYDDSISKKFYAGPCWDYDQALAGAWITDDGIDLRDPNGLYAALQRKDSDIWYALYQHEDFREKAAEIFFKEIEPQMRKDSGKMVYAFGSRIEASNECNMIRWNTFYQAESIAEKKEMYGAKLDELAAFIDRRIDFLESEWRYLRNE